jgi:hypothetical protein
MALLSPSPMVLEPVAAVTTPPPSPPHLPSPPLFKSRPARRAAVLRSIVAANVGASPRPCSSHARLQPDHQPTKPRHFTQCLQLPQSQTQFCQKWRAECFHVVSLLCVRSAPLPSLPLGYSPSHSQSVTRPHSPLLCFLNPANPKRPSQGSGTNQDPRLVPESSTRDKYPTIKTLYRHTKLSQSCPTAPQVCQHGARAKEGPYEGRTTYSTELLIEMSQTYITKPSTPSTDQLAAFLFAAHDACAAGPPPPLAHSLNWHEGGLRCRVSLQHCKYPCSSVAPQFGEPLMANDACCYCCCCCCCCCWASSRLDLIRMCWSRICREGYGVRERALVGM